MPRPSDDMPDFGDREALRDEMIRLYAARQFCRAPVMRKLLGYLISETLGGNDGRLKAYTIAVDALGKPPSFDPQSDAYPRVQVGRLRALLDAFYEENGAAGALRFAIAKGGYTVAFGDEAAPSSVAVEVTAEEPSPIAAVPVDDQDPTIVPLAIPADRAIEAALERLRFWRAAASVLAAIALVLGVLHITGPTIV